MSDSYLKLTDAEKIMKEDLENRYSLENYELMSSKMGTDRFYFIVLFSVESEPDFPRLASYIIDEDGDIVEADFKPISFKS